MPPTINDLRPDELDNYNRTMGILDEMTEEERRNVLSHVYITAIIHRRDGDPKILEGMARGLLDTIRLHGSAAFKKAMADTHPPGLSPPAGSVKEVLDSLPR